MSWAILGQFWILEIRSHQHILRHKNIRFSFSCHGKVQRGSWGLQEAIVHRVIQETVLVLSSGVFRWFWDALGLSWAFLGLCRPGLDLSSILRGYLKAIVAGPKRFKHNGISREFKKHRFSMFFAFPRTALTIL
jgi:hypothetical protein